MTARIVFTHSILHFGSTEGYLRDLMRSLDPAEFEIWFAAPDHETLEPLFELDELEGRTVRLPLAPEAGASVRLRAYRAALARLRPGLVHSGDVDPPAMIAARVAGVRRLVVTHHTPELVPPDNPRGAALRRLGWATRPHVVFTSGFDRETGIAREPIARRRTTVIPLSIDLERFDPARVQPERLASDGPVVGSVGLLRAQKGQRSLIEAAELVVRELPEATFVLAGEGELRPELERRIREHGLEGRFRLLGRRTDIPALLAGFDLFVLSSEFEGMCLAVAESLAMGTPVVATAVGGVPQTVRPDETGLLVAPRDPEALANAILWTLRNPDAAERMALAGQARVRELYPLDRMVTATADLYDRLLRRR